MENPDVEPRTEPDPILLGALVGWRSFPTSHGVALRLQTTTSLEAAKRGALGVHDVQLSVTQMRVLALNLDQLADQRDGIRRPKKRGWFW